MIERRPHWWLPVGLVAVISLPSYGADSSVPALLQFAEHYQNPKAAPARPLAETKVPPAPVIKPVESDTIKKLHQLDANLRVNLRKKEQQLQRQQAEINALQSKLEALKQRPAEPVAAEPKADVAGGLTQLIQGVRKGFQRPPDQQKAADLLRVAQQERAQALAQAQQAKQDNQSLRQRLSQLQSKTDKDVAISQDSADKRIQSLSHQLQDLQTQRQQTQEQLATALNSAKQSQQDNQALQQQLSDLQSKADKDVATAKNGLETTQKSLSKELLDAQTQQQQTAEQLAAMQKEHRQAQADAKQAQQDVQALRQQLTVLQSKSDKDVVAAQTSLEKNTQSLTKQLQEVQKQQQQSAEQLVVVQKERAQAQADATQAQQDAQALRQQLAELTAKADKDLTASQKGLESTTASLNKQLQDVQRQLQQSADLLGEKDKTLAQFEKDIQGLKGQLTLLQPDVKMVTPKDKQSYAAGVALGRNVLEVQAEQASIGVPTDRKLLLSGIVDSFNGSYKLAPDALTKAMRDTDKEVFQAKKKNMTRQKTMSESYLSKFSKKKGSQKADSGFWYHIDYPGDDNIPEGAVLDVVVQESLTDGTIIQDMDVNGSVLSQSIDRYPPLFREALSKLKNHGSITMVVPPELAYGDKGYPPKIPPNSTMVYVVRIVDVIPAKK
ncbi:FKBP-type peptidyl-prolyl cis-trans isomerase N-terminal domain-containing protein [Rouxiella sp. Mn2063]|uniref:FKBP-type peptidyl-prolyl cis-trans isomerase N-terminal domain-containing protein n=1 Tax=Rouxiella sp. Mn2063 TaxID=3395262 RepID=UPI003BD0CA27